MLLHIQGLTNYYCMCPDSSSMDQREEYWRDSILHDPEEYSNDQQYESIHPQQPQHRLSHPNYPQHLASPPHGSGLVPQHLQHQHRHHHPRYDQSQLHQPSRHNTTISVADVLCGRGKTSFNHEGNKTFRTAVSAALDDFINAVNRFEKGIVVQRVVDMVHARGGRFLKEDTRAGTWYQLSEQQSKEKVGHAIRDAANLYEVRKKKEEQMHHHHDTTPLLKRTGSDEESKGPDWWKSYGTEEHIESSSRGDRSKSYRSSYTPTDFSVDYSNTSAAKRRGSMAPSLTTDYEPQRKRRRTTLSSEQSYFHSTMALSDHILSTPSPRYSEDPFVQQPTTEVRKSPIIHDIPTTTSNVVSSDGSQKSLIVGGGLMTSVASKLKSSPIAPIVPPPASSKESKYYHRFTVYDPQEQQASGTKDIHRQFHPESETEEFYSSPIEANRPPQQQASQYSGTTSYPYGRSDFVRLPVPQSSSRFSYDGRYYPYGQYQTMPTPTGILPPMGHFPPYPQQHYGHQQRPHPTSYGPHNYYQPPPQPHTRGRSTIPFNITSDWVDADAAEESNGTAIPILPPRQQHQEINEGDSDHGDGNETNNDAAIA